MVIQLVQEEAVVEAEAGVGEEVAEEGVGEEVMIAEAVALVDQEVSKVDAPIVDQIETSHQVEIPKEVTYVIIAINQDILPGIVPINP